MPPGALVSSKRPELEVSAGVIDQALPRSAEMIGSGNAAMQRHPGCNVSCDGEQRWQQHTETGATPRVAGPDTAPCCLRRGTKPHHGQ
mmetsp:Transcript_27884/g.63055  ORF Transcript_27884/g.63055 Transcript_27884/m.63055 type:complete len:88 (+) Transcript_27884:68-331(+)